MADHEVTDHAPVSPQSSKEQIILLTERVKTVEHLARRQMTQIEALQAVQNATAGADEARRDASESTSRWLLPSIQIVLGVLFSAFSLHVIDTNKEQWAEIHEIDNTVETRFEAKDQRVGFIEKAVEKSDATLSELETSLTETRDNVRTGRVEFQTQLRALNDVYNLMAAQTYRTTQLLWRKTYSEDLPDIEYFSKAIPAQAAASEGAGF